MTATVLIFAARLSGLAALALGASYWAGVAVPLHAHMGVGGVLVLCLWGLAVLARRRAAGLALGAALLGMAVPMLGMMQIHLYLGGALGLLRLVHVAAGLGAIALAETMARRLRLLKSGRADTTQEGADDLA